MGETYRCFSVSHKHEWNTKFSGFTVTYSNILMLTHIQWKKKHGMTLWKNAWVRKENIWYIFNFLMSIDRITLSRVGENFQRTTRVLVHLYLLSPNQICRKMSTPRAVSNVIVVWWWLWCFKNMLTRDSCLPLNKLFILRSQ